VFYSSLSELTAFTNIDGSISLFFVLFSTTERSRDFLVNVTGIIFNQIIENLFIDVQDQLRSLAPFPTDRAQTQRTTPESCCLLLSENNLISMLGDKRSIW
jgi:hypothetical protein